MKSKQIALFLTIYLAFTPFAFAKKGDDLIIQKFIEVSNTVPIDYDLASDKLDSIEMFLSMEMSEKYQPYLDYSNALLAYRRTNYVRSLQLTDKAIEKFLYMEERDWVARCLVNIGNIAELTRLIPEATNAFMLALEHGSDSRVLGAAHLGLARNQLRMKRSWNSHLKQGVELYKNSGERYLELYSEFIYYWFYQDSSDVTIVVPGIAKEFREIKQYNREADAYKCLVFHYQKIKDFDAALLYIDKSIAAYEKEQYTSKTLLASVYYLKGKILLELDRYDDAMQSFDEAFFLNQGKQLRGNNYMLYRYLYDYEIALGNYKVASEYTLMLIDSYRATSDMRIDRYEQMSKLFRKIQFIENEIDGMKAHSLHMTLVYTLSIALFFTILLWWMRSKKLHFEKLSVEMELSNMRLKEETGELLFKTKHNAFTNELSKTMHDFERKAERYLAENDELPDVLKDKYAETFLLCGARFPQLSDSEKRYAVMFILDIKAKAIAELFNVQHLTVAQYRNRIRKKLYISNTQIRLEEFLKQQII